LWFRFGLGNSVSGIVVCPFKEEDGLTQAALRRSYYVVLDDYFESSLPIPTSPMTVLHVQQKDYNEIDI
jgi:hypothetical protein